MKLSNKLKAVNSQMRFEEICSIKKLYSSFVSKFIKKFKTSLDTSHRDVIRLNHSALIAFASF